MFLLRLLGGRDYGCGVFCLPLRFRCGPGLWSVVVVGLGRLLLSLVAIYFVTFLAISYNPSGPPRNPNSKGSSVPGGPGSSMGSAVMGPSPKRPERRICRCNGYGGDMGRNMFCDDRGRAAVNTTALVSSGGVLGCNGGVINIHMCLNRGICGASMFFNRSLDGPTVAGSFRHRSNN